ncbi:MAG: hypothetical protein KAI79_00945 [Bacteroidales bacterium]|nr:hypothetical protein [Bacteroidales bacterium]
MKVCFLSSGNGGNFKFLHLAKKLKLLDNIELTVIADRECGSMEYAQKHNIYAKVIHYTRDENKNLLTELDYINPNIIVTNWYKIIDTQVVSKYRGKLINLHYSLLPAFVGLIGIEPIKAAYKQNCQFTGTTCHYVDEGVDTGNIISQAIVKTNIPIEDAIGEIFQKGCLILLSSLLIVSDESIIPVSKNIKYNFSPSLQFNDELFNSQFWEKLSKL